ncbi:unnamed protein product [Rotaria sp. Silwood1]|nr:unnamed protein product [Rotaria sp. Silwood1]CAF1529553.1 unnamed protein product [Rotaria sp. Silwood1]CAF3711267.1 unnamed protein product [Rotaria sp. Silwood1]CAF4570765.1 unnamed protein product [Rotaria sp. Silwood1]CAF4884448.1 unnamed protein product [Rotaria sp. Silwood1]
MKPNKRDKEELIKLLKNEYKDNDAELKLINEFNHKYQSVKAIWWYTRESCVYRLLNKALRIQNVDILFLFRNVIRDIFEQLRAHQCQEHITVYRGQVISKEELNQLRESMGNIISMNSFLSTTLNRRVAVEFLQESISSSSVSDDVVPILFEIEADPCVLDDTSQDNRRPFAKVAGLSAYEDESEVLFMLGSIFCLNEIYYEQSSADSTMSIIRMTLCGDYDNDLKQLYDHMKKEYHREEANLLSLGDTMFDMGKFDLAEKYYCRSLRELPSDDSSLSELYHNLGMVADAKVKAT